MESPPPPTKKSFAHKSWVSATLIKGEQIEEVHHITYTKEMFSKYFAQCCLAFVLTVLISQIYGKAIEIVDGKSSNLNNHWVV